VLLSSWSVREIVQWTLELLYRDQQTKWFTRIWRHSVFVISLCINDLCTLFFVVLVIIDSYVWRRWRAGDVMCRLNPELTVAFTGCTLWHTALIAIHRYLVVVHGDAYHRISKRAYTALAPNISVILHGTLISSLGLVPPPKKKKLGHCITERSCSSYVVFIVTIVTDLQAGFLQQAVHGCQWIHRTSFWVRDLTFEFVYSSSV